MYKKNVKWVEVSLHALSLLPPGRIAEAIFLVLSLPGHGMFVHTLWSGERPVVSLRVMMVYVIPHCLLPQLASSLSSSILGSMGVFSFCLVILGDYALGKS